MVHSRLHTSLLAIFTCLLWSSAFAGVKIGLQYNTPLQFAGTRFFISGLLVLPLAITRHPGYMRVFRRQFRFILLIAFLQTFLQYALFYTGLNLIPGAVGAIVIGSQPLFVALIAHFLMPGDRMTAVKMAVIGAGITGVILVSLGKDPGSITGQIAISGVLLLVAINILSGFNNVIIAKEKGAVPPLVLSSASLTIGGASLFLVSLLLEGWNPGPKPAPYYLSLGWLSMLSAVAISIWTMLLKQPGVVVSDLNLWKFLIPLSGAILSWILVPGEDPQVLAVTGMILIAGSLVVLGIVQRKSHAILREKGYI